MEATMKEAESGAASKRAGCLKPVVGAALGLALGVLAGLVIGLVAGVVIALILGVL